ncbi:MAG TPA: NAD(P)/FAD-dependent oxidoreductase [Polyangia bacterium]|jgi:phytoene dehydrogenase-like protein|nr:NAD(P)/FAD-dependent oxidoreductase [Polyangia bacterium]
MAEQQRHVVIIGGGLAGLSAGCYARASGFRATIIEHNLALGGVCTAWRRGPYLIDGCIHWLTGGPFLRVYEELGVLQRLRLRPLQHYATFRDERDGLEIAITADLPAFARALELVAREDRDELDRIVEGAHAVAAMAPPLDRPQELYTLRDGLGMLWNLRHELPTFVHFRKPMADYAREHLRNARLRHILTRLVPEEAPALVLLMILGYLQRGWLSRPEGGTLAFRDALIESYHGLGGEARLHSTVDEVLVEGGRARGVRLGDGSFVEADAVICTASAPETLFRLLGGRYGADEMRRRMAEWKMFPPIVLASYGLATPLAGAPQILHLDGIEPLEVGGRRNETLYLRIYNDDPSFAPPGHTVLQALLTTDYGWWATRGSNYVAEKDALGEAILTALDRYLPGVQAALRVVDLATPLTFWNMARSWRGAYEGWLPNADALFGHVRKQLDGLSGFYMAGQWVEPGGGVPTACASGRAAVQLLCADEKRAFEIPHRAGLPGG